MLRSTSLDGDFLSLSPCDKGCERHTQYQGSKYPRHPVRISLNRGLGRLGFLSGKNKRHAIIAPVVATSTATAKALRVSLRVMSHIISWHIMSRPRVATRATRYNWLAQQTSILRCRVRKSASQQQVWGGTGRSIEIAFKPWRSTPAVLNGYEIQAGSA